MAELNKKVQAAISAQFESVETQLSEAEKMLGGRTLADKKAFLQSNKQNIAAALEGLQQANDGAAQLQVGIDAMNQVIGLYDSGMLTDEQFTEANGFDINTARAKVKELEDQLDGINKSIAETGENPLRRIH